MSARLDRVGCCELATLLEFDRNVQRRSPWQAPCWAFLVLTILLAVFGFGLALGRVSLRGLRNIVLPLGLVPLVMLVVFDALAHHAAAV